MMRIIIAHNMLKEFLVFSCADNLFLKFRSLKALNLVKKGNFSFYAYFVGHFCYHYNRKI